jgi:hypothetical protein
MDGYEVQEGVEGSPQIYGDHQVDAEKVNRQFNDALARQMAGALPPAYVYQLGMPGAILLSIKFPYLPIELTAARLAMKSGESNVHHHPFSISAMKDLPKALQKPLAVFSYGNKAASQNVITQVNVEGKNVLAGVHFSQTKRGVAVNDIRGLYPKDNAEWLNWITQQDGHGESKLLYVDKSKIQTLIAQQRTTLAEVSYLDLNSVTKIVQNFQNPNIFVKKIGGVALTPAQQQALASGEAVRMEGLVNRTTGQLQTAYVRRSPEDGRLRFYQEHPEQLKGAAHVPPPKPADRRGRGL